MKLKNVVKAAAGGCVLLCAGAACAQDAKDFPNRPIRIMGGGVGSTADYLSRFIGQKLTEKWNQPVVVDSRAGAGGTLAADVVAKAAPDGYNLVMGHAGPMVSAVALYKDIPYDPVRDFAPVSRMTTGVVVLVTHPTIPVSSAKELIAYIKQNSNVKGGLSYASAGNGSMSHLAGELFNGIAGVKVLHIPYKSAGLALTALLFTASRPVATLSLPQNKAAVIVALDTSRSMLATDADPNRLEVAKSIVKKFIERAPADTRIGLVTFSEKCRHRLGKSLLQTW